MTVSDGKQTESTLSLADGELHVYEDGPRDAPALLLIHGTAASGRSWDPLVPLLTGSHRVIRIDLLGCGRSARPDGASYAVADQARRVGVAMDRLGVGHAVVAGHSSGGVIVTALAELRPELVGAAVLINTGPDMDAYVAKDVPRRATAWAELSDDEIRQAMSDGFRPGFEIPRDYVDQFRDIDFAVFGATSVAVRAYLDERSLPARLAVLGKPWLVLFGEEDRRWTVSSAGGYRVVPGALVELLGGVGHSPNLEDPARTAAAMLAFTAGRGVRG
ncbi:alpha/beta fold hydrolase [Actinophytocola sp.]|uniref:alpha/beta fold hydrolase n=1 Tax=Actinophytocola sp. TaxID=1872138 RepID=UPI003899B4C8